MYNKCESCGKNIESSDDCRLFSNDGIKVHTYCYTCYMKRKVT